MLGPTRTSSTPKVLLLLLLSAILWLLFPWGRERFSREFLSSEKLRNMRLSDAPWEVDVLEDTANRTLGFQKIYVLLMPSRSDRRDALTLAAHISGIQLEFIDGVVGGSVSPKALPYSWPSRLPPGTLGCWRGHMNIYQKMMNQQIQSALVMEGDVDWDVMIKAQMKELARGARYLQNTSASSRSPYGDDWDLLFTGHCGAANWPEEDQEYWVTENDPTVLGPSEREAWRHPNLTPAPLGGNHSRLIFRVSDMSCTASYAISLQGASRLVYDQAILPHSHSIDMGMANFCKRSEYDRHSCLAAFPMITGIHKPAGNMSSDSERLVTNVGKIRKKAKSVNLVYPVRLNIGSLLKGKTKVKAQVPNAALLPEIDVSTLKLPEGKPVFVQAKEYGKFKKPRPKNFYDD